MLENVACTFGYCSEFPTYALMMEQKVKCGLDERVSIVSFPPSVKGGNENFLGALKGGGNEIFKYKGGNFKKGGDET